jgi:hypothetical protein
MSRTKGFTPRFLTATEYVLALHAPQDQVAVLARNRNRKQTVQRILPAETVANPDFQQWLTEQNLAGADIFIGMNPVKDGAHSRTKEYIREIRHAYLDLDEDAGASLQAIRTTGDVPVPNFGYIARKTSGSLASRRLGTGPSRVSATRSGVTVRW